MQTPLEIIHEELLEEVKARLYKTILSLRECDDDYTRDFVLNTMPQTMLPYMEQVKVASKILIESKEEGLSGFIVMDAELVDDKVQIQMQVEDKVERIRAPFIAFAPVGETFTVRFVEK